MNYAVTITETEDHYIVKSRYHSGLIKQWSRIHGRRWDVELRANIFPKAAKRMIWEAMCIHLPGVLCTGPKGEFRVPAPIKEEKSPPPRGGVEVSVGGGPFQRVDPKVAARDLFEHLAGVARKHHGF